MAREKLHKRAMGAEGRTEVVPGVPPKEAKEPKDNKAKVKALRQRVRTKEPLEPPAIQGNGEQKASKELKTKEPKVTKEPNVTKEQKTKEPKTKESNTKEPKTDRGEARELKKPSGELYRCLKEQKEVNAEQEVLGYDKRGFPRLMGVCSNCGVRVFRYIKKGTEENYT